MNINLLPMLLKLLFVYKLGNRKLHVKLTTKNVLNVVPGTCIFQTPAISHQYFDF
uniref:Uncharacterized protein n=1 Tax=Arundo donax TaxID=35708 RepID=A0A0A8Y2T0_ARUDO